MKLYKNNKKRNISLRLTLFVFLMTLVSSLLTTGLMSLLYNIDPTNYIFSIPYFLFLLIFVVVVALGTGLARLFAKPTVKQIDLVVNAMEEISNENFEYRLDRNDVKDLGDIGEKFNKMAEELSSLETFKSNFISAFSHEFKTPIASIRGFAKLLCDKDLPEEQQKEYLDIIYTEADRLTTLTENTLFLSRIENQHYVYETTNYSLDEQLRKCMLLLESQWLEKNLQLDIDLDEIMVHANYDHLQHMWLNLIGNAIKFSNDGGTITLSAHIEKGAAVIKIGDTGMGISPEETEKIFDKFYQCDNSHSTSGNGLGLAICKKLADLNGYKLTVTSELSVGTVFTLTVPAKDVVPRR